MVVTQKTFDGQRNNNRIHTPSIKTRVKYVTFLTKVRSLLKEQSYIIMYPTEFDNRQNHFKSNIASSKFILWLQHTDNLED